MLLLCFETSIVQFISLSVLWRTNDAELMCLLGFMCHPEFSVGDLGRVRPAVVRLLDIRFCLQQL